MDNPQASKTPNLNIALDIDNPIHRRMLRGMLDAVDSPTQVTTIEAPKLAAPSPQQVAALTEKPVDSKKSLTEMANQLSKSVGEPKKKLTFKERAAIASRARWAKHRGEGTVETQEAQPEPLKKKSSRPKINRAFNQMQKLPVERNFDDANKQSMDQFNHVEPDNLELTPPEQIDNRDILDGTFVKKAKRPKTSQFDIQVKDEDEDMAELLRIREEFEE